MQDMMNAIAAEVANRNLPGNYKIEFDADRP